MRKNFKILTSFMLICTLILGMFCMTGCVKGGEATAYSVKNKLINALNALDYDAYYSLAYPPLRNDIEKEMKDLGLSKEEYMQHIKDTYYPFDEDTMISESSKSFAQSTEYDAARLQLIIDQFIYYDDYLEIEKAESASFLIRDYRYSDADAPAFYEMNIVTVSAEGNYFFTSFKISDTPYEEIVTETTPVSE